MPQDGQPGVATDGTPVIWSAALGAAVPTAQYNAMKKAVAPPKNPGDATTLTGLSKTAQASQDLADASNDFAIRNETTPTGGWLAIPGAPALAKALGLRGSNNLPAMQADSMKAATAATRAISSRPAAFEFMKNLGAVQNIATAQPDNAPIQQQNNNKMIMAKAMDAFYQEYSKRMGGSLNGADHAWSTWAGQHFDPQGNFSTDPRNTALKTQSAISARAPAAVPDGGTIDLFGRPVSGGDDDD